MLNRRLWRTAGPARPPTPRRRDSREGEGRGEEGRECLFLLLSTSQCNFVRVQLPKLPGQGHRPGIRAFPVLPAGREDEGGQRQASSKRVPKSLPTAPVALRRRPGRGPTPPASSARSSRLRHFLPASWAASPPLGRGNSRAGVTGTSAEANGGGARRQGPPRVGGEPGGARRWPRAARGARSAAGPSAAPSGAQRGLRWKDSVSWERRPSWRAASSAPATGEPPPGRRRRGPRRCRRAARMLGCWRRRGARPGLPGRPECRCTTPSTCASSGPW